MDRLQVKPGNRMLVFKEGFGTASLSSGEFVGIVPDNPDHKIDLKAFYCEILNDHAALQKDQDSYEPLPVNRKVTFQEIQEN